VGAAQDAIFRDLGLGAALLVLRLAFGRFFFIADFFGFVAPEFAFVGLFVCRVAFGFDFFAFFAASNSSS
jgi:hypothetical protein